MTRMKHKNHPCQRHSQLSTRNIVEDYATHFGKPVAYGFVKIFHEIWMIETCTGSQKVQQLR